MTLGPRLDLRQSQSLVMTPQLQQAIRLLALSNLEVEGFIAEEIEKNPLLDSSAPEDDGPTQEREAEAPLRDEPASADELVISGGGADESLDVDFATESFHHDSAADSAGGGMDGALGLNGASGGAGGEDLPDLDRRHPRSGARPEAARHRRAHHRP